jgi:predicted DCC family thiol-disulfide oxidoreductase YuxK
MANWQIKLFFDGQCPLCAREQRFLERLDRGRGRLAFEDITDPSFDPADYGLTEQEVHDQIHGVLPNDRVVRGLEVFRRAYAAVGYGWLLAPTKWPVIKPIADKAYQLFARNRLRLTGRCRSDACGIHPHHSHASDS